jgi:ubiquinol-cytochrome c reductase cytochrome b subunit
MWASIKNWLEIRIGLDELIKTHLTEYRVPKNINLLYTLGFVALVTFALQVITGLFLLIYYIPYSEMAFRSVQEIMSTVPYGWLFRQMHVVGSTLMVVLVLFHALAVFFMGGYKKPRELTWIVGTFMLLLTIAFCLSGYLLPWSQLSYWATTIATTIPTAFPYVGDLAANVMKGGPQVSGITLNRFFAIHVMLLPLVLSILLGLHLFLVRRVGISSPPFGESRQEEKSWTAYRHESHPDGYPFFPDFVLKETVMVMVCLAVMFFIISFSPTLLLPVEANVPADPFKTPAHIKPEWYFLAPYQMLKIIPNKFVGISLQILIVLIFILWPFLDSREEKNLRTRPRLLGFTILALILWIGFTIWGKYS